ncbi:SIMPL domain-containing protein [Plebeiibacterium sediminum]|uniref:SIMPL domain-containing protein n=1 Tax=Plebeiibacterium sediminum TaxID=2992112 RepID=A0AAE3M6N3_9BACT|nr:SIMPL domain-containing protein [Plebeiobacterium sediminum]MCW3787570.1 SIMPL domain-containing protein [Plebeiobacterium sediminum]
MKKIVLILFALISLNSFAQNKNFIDQNYIEVTGKAELEVVPNEIYLKIFIDEKDLKGKDNLEDLEKQMIKKLEGIGIDISKDLSVKDMASNFKNYWIKGKEIHSSKEYQLKVSDAKTAGAVFQELEAINISNIRIEKVDHSDIDEYKQKVKVLAIKAAKQKAIALTKEIGQTTGKAIYIQELNNRVYRAMQSYETGAASNIMVRGTTSLAKMAVPDIEFEKIQLEYSILVRFTLD